MHDGKYIDSGRSIMHKANTIEMFHLSTLLSSVICPDCGSYSALWQKLICLIYLLKVS